MSINFGGGHREPCIYYLMLGGVSSFQRGHREQIPLQAVMEIKPERCTYTLRGHREGVTGRELILFFLARVTGRKSPGAEILIGLL